MLRTYKEKIDTECPGILEKSAIKVDGKGNGLKIHLKLNSISSCDYIRLDKSKKTIIFIEITDIKSKYRELVIENSLVDPVKNSLTAQTLKRINPDSIILKELKDKFLGTLTIYAAIERKYSLKHRNVAKYVVGFCLGHTSEVRILPKLKSQLKGELGAAAISVEVLPTDALKNLF